MNNIHLKQNQEPIKFGLTLYSAQILKVIQIHPWLKEVLQRDNFSKYIYQQGNEHKDLPLKQQQYVKYALQTSSTRCAIFHPNLIAHINFTNLQSLEISDNDVFNIEALSFIDLSKLKSLEIGGQFGSYREEPDCKSNKLRSIQPLVKCHFPKIRYINLDCGKINSMGRNNSRLSMSKMKNIVLEHSWSSDYWIEELRDEDISIWLKIDTKRLHELEILSQEDLFEIDRIRQNKIDECLRRRWKKTWIRREYKSGSEIQQSSYSQSNSAKDD